MFIAGKTLQKGKPVPFVMELPNYRLPSFKSVCLLLWEKISGFVKKAFSIIFIATLIIWFLNSYDLTLTFVADSNKESILQVIGNLLAPIFKPITGVYDGRIVASLVSGFAAKEAVISTLTMLGANLSTVIPSVAGVLGFLTFVLLYTPCIATVATIKKELNSFTKTLLFVIFQCVIAYVMACLVYLIASLII